MAKWAIADVHGCSHAFETLVKALQPTARDEIILLGDLVDRGPDSRGVLEQCIKLTKRVRLTGLLGNHDEIFCDLVADANSSSFFGLLAPEASYQWFIRAGGAETLRSYNLPVSRRFSIPREHIEFLKGLRPWYEDESIVAVHAYYEPSTPMSRQTGRALRWTWLPPNPEPHCSGMTAIVGHTPQKSGQILDLGFLKCLDCIGAGWLTAMELGGAGRIIEANERGELRAPLMNAKS